MAIILDGNIGVTYPDVTTQNTSAIIGGKLPTARLPAGSILQMIQTVKTDTFTTSSGSFTDVTGLTVSITPTSSSSKILVLYDVGLSCQNGTGAPIRMLRGSTVIYAGDAAGNRPLGIAQIDGASTQYSVPRISGTFLDSPATTSSITYKFQTLNTASGTSAVNRAQQDRNESTYDTRTASSITVMEIAV
jgi:hypothetical protein